MYVHPVSRSVSEQAQPLCELLSNLPLLQILREYQDTPVVADEALQRVLEVLDALKAGKESTDDAEVGQALARVMSRLLLLVRAATEAMEMGRLSTPHVLSIPSCGE